MRLSAFGPVKSRLKVKPVGAEIRSVRDDVDAVAVVVEGSLVEQRRADHIRGVNHGAVRGVAESIGDRWDVIAAPLGGSVGLRDLLGDPVSKHRELGTELVVDAGNFFSQVVGELLPPEEIRAAVGLREDPAVLATGGQQGCRVRRSGSRESCCWGRACPGTRAACSPPSSSNRKFAMPLGTTAVNRLAVVGSREAPHQFQRRLASGYSLASGNRQVQAGRHRSLCAIPCCRRRTSDGSSSPGTLPPTLNP